MGENPKHPLGNTEQHVCHPSHVATWPTTMQGGADTKDLRLQQDGEQPHAGGTPYQCHQKTRIASPQRGSPHCMAPTSSSTPQHPSSLHSFKDLAGREPSIADECGRHSSLPMDPDSATTGTVTRPKGWTLDSPVVPLVQKILFAANNRGKHGPAAIRQCCSAHGSAKLQVPCPSLAPPKALIIKVQTH